MTDSSDEKSYPNWCDARLYESMLVLDRRAWAWQCVSRNEEFLALAASVTPAASRIVRGDPLIAVITLPSDDRLVSGGCTFARRHGCGLERSFVAWRADSDRAVVVVEASPAAPDDPYVFDLTSLICPVLVFKGISGVEHLLIGDSAFHVRLDVTAGTVLEGPVRFQFALAGSAGLEAKLLTLRRLMALVRRGRFPCRLFPPSQRARRWMMALRALDARRAGATHREIAVALFGEATAATDWDGRSAYLRCRVQRLIRLGETLVRGGYRRLLNNGDEYGGRTGN